MSRVSAEACEIVVAVADAAGTARLARLLAGLARKGDVIGLAGALGTGKTTFARAFIAALSARPPEVPSPTFTLLQIYDGREAPIFHFDLYRLDSPEDAWELGIEEAFAEGISLVEWPERLGPLAPPEMLCVRLEAAEPGHEARRIRLTGGPSWGPRLARIEERFAAVDHDG